jgi:diadenosine hexaphosphate hydrolase (ATP-forming)
MRNGEPEFLLVTARSPRVEWVYPKGHIDPGEDAAEAAVREVEEEAGVGAAIVQVVGDVTVRIGAAEQVVRYFLMTTTEEGEPREGRAYAWLGAADALARLTFPESRDSLRSAIEALRRRSST